MMRYTLTLKKVVLPALLLAIVVVGMQLSSCKKKKDSPISTQVSLATIDFKDTTLLTKAVVQTYVATNLPQGVSVDYTGSIQQAPGEYILTATFTLNGGYTWAASEMPDAAGKVVKTAKVTIADYLTAPTTASDGSNAVAIKKAADIYADVTIPASLFSFPVVSIDSGAFANNTTITSVKVPENVTYVGKVFWGCTNLAKVDLPATLKTIENEAFVKAPNPLEMKVVALHPALTTIIMRGVEPPKITNYWQYKNTGNATDDFKLTFLGTEPWLVGQIKGDNQTVEPAVKVYVKDLNTQGFYRTGSNDHPGSWDWTKYWNQIDLWSNAPGGVN